MNLGWGYPLGKKPHEARDIEIDEETRTRHIYCVAQSGAGKTSFLKTLLDQDARGGQGFAVLDVEESVAPFALSALVDVGAEPEGVVVIDPTITTAAVPLNFLAPGVSHPHTQIEEVVYAMKRAWADAWGPRLDDILRHSLALLQEHRLTLAELPLLLSRRDFREELAKRSQDERVRLFFLHHLGNVPEREWRVWVEAVRNKASAFVGNPFIEPFIAAEECQNFRAVMDEGKALIVNLPDRVLKDSGRLLGMLIVSKLYTAALERPEGSRLFSVYADEFQAIASRSFLDLYTRTRKRGVGVVAAHQNLSQPPFDRDPAFLDTILANTTTQVFMQMGRQDAERLAKEVFTFSGTEVKRQKKHWLWRAPVGDPKFYSVQEEQENAITELTSQHPRECVIKVKGEGVWVATTYDVPELEATAEQARELAEASVQRWGVPVEQTQAAQAARTARFLPSKPKDALSRSSRKAGANRASVPAEYEGDPI